MSEDRRIVKIDAVLDLISGQGGDQAAELLNFLTRRGLTTVEADVAAPLAKAWLCAQNPEFLKSKYGEGEIYAEWQRKEAKRLGDNVSLEPIPEEDMAGIGGVLDLLGKNASTIAEQAETISGLEGQVAELEPFKAQAADLEKKVEGLEGQVAGLEEAKKELAGKVAEFEGKLPVAENEINDTIKDIVTKALKDAVASVPMGGAAPAEGGEAEAAAPAADDGSTAAPPDDFGFGSSGDDSDGFGF